MSTRPIPAHVVLACAFGFIGAIIASAIVHHVVSSLRTFDATITSANAEADGVRYVVRMADVLRLLLAYRSTLVDAEVAGRRSRLQTERGSVTHAIAALRDPGPTSGEPHATLIDDAVVSELDALGRRWSLLEQQPVPTSEEASAAIATIEPLLESISTVSGIATDPTIEGKNLGDALRWYPRSLVAANDAGAVAIGNVVTRNGALGPRFAATGLLQRAQAAIDVGYQSAAREMSLGSIDASALIEAASANVRDFDALARDVDRSYIRALPDRSEAGASRHARIIARDVDRFTGSSLGAIATVERDVGQLVTARVAATLARRVRVIATAAAAILIDAIAMTGLAWINIVSVRNARRRAAAENAALESQRATLEGQLASAKAQQAFARAHAEFQAVFDNAPTGMIIVDRDYEIRKENDAARAMFVSAGGIVAEAIARDHAPVIEKMFAGELAIFSGERVYPVEDDQPRWFDVSIAPVQDEDASIGYAVLMIRDISDRKALEAKLVFEAGHDLLTGLPNRKRFLDVLQCALDERGGGTGGAVFAVVFIDLLDFKTINDSFGHQAGDAFLVDAATRLRASVRSSDVVARVGGDEFAVLLHGSDRTDVENSVKRLAAVIAVPVHIEGQVVTISASFGVAQSELQYTLATEMMRDADTAMYCAKAEGDTRPVVFDSSMREQVMRRMQLSIDLVHALAHDELELWYQPIVDLATGSIAGCEALVRWRRSDGTFISPTEFIPLAEENGSILEIGRWIVATACRQMNAWNDLHRCDSLPGLTDAFAMHVNLSVPEVHHPDLLENLVSCLAHTNVPTRQIILEITEGVVLKNTPLMHEKLFLLTSSGFRLCVDDFGTGYSSLRYLNELPLHGFKIDRSFVFAENGGLANASIIEMLMILSRSLDLTVVAEGIETSTQWQRLHELGCRFGQGFLFAEALDGDAFATLLRRNAQFPFLMRAHDEIANHAAIGG